MSSSTTEQSGHPVAERHSNALLAVVMDQPVRRKLLASFILVSLLVVLVGSLGLTSLSATNSNLTSMYTKNFPAVVQVGVVRAAVLQTAVDLRDLGIAQTVVATQAVLAKDGPDLAALNAAVASYAKIGPADANAFAALKTDVATWLRLRPGAVKFAASVPTEVPQLVAYIAAKLTPVRVRVDHDIDTATAAEKAHATTLVKQSQSDYSSARVLALSVMIGAVVLALTIALFLSRIITGPLKETVRVLQGLAKGHLNEKVAVTDRSEVGTMGLALNESIDHLRAVIGDIAQHSQVLASSSEELTAVSGSVSSSAEESSVQAQVVAAAAEQISRNIETVAAGGEQMGAAIREIANNASQATEVANRAAATAASANATIAKLGESSDEIGKVVRVITSIAEQTNLLALNATIEAARAGEAGKGFAVVANEVKELAQACASATDDVSTRVQTTQADVRAAVAAISEITAVIAQINDIQVVISSAVEEQAATTSEMVRNVAEVSAGSSEIAANITGIATASTETTDSATHTAQAADELAHIATQLNQAVSTFQL